METIKTIFDIITDAAAVGFVIIMIAGLCINSNKIKKLENKQKVTDKNKAENVILSVNFDAAKRLQELKNGK